MTTILDSLREYYEDKRTGTALAAVPMHIGGDNESLACPYVTLTETGADEVEQDGVPMRGVYSFEIACELHTVPGETADTATDETAFDLMRWDLLNIMADKAVIQWAEIRNSWRIFDIRAGGPTIEAEDGQRICRINLTAIACPRI